MIIPSGLLAALLDDDARLWPMRDDDHFATATTADMTPLALSAVLGVLRGSPFALVEQMRTAFGVRQFWAA